MPLSFQTAETLFKNDEISELYRTEEGRRFLLLRSLSRRENLEKLVADYNLSVQRTGFRELFQAVYNSPVSIEQLKTTIREIFTKERRERAEHEPELIDELYKMREFYWGGLHQNSLEKTIINNYVKKIRRYDQLNEKIENEIFESMRGYVRCSWYNNWTSIIIEDIFKEHRNVLPAVGLVKKIDFFLRDVPFDLKVTYLPEGFVKKRRDASGDKKELTLLKRAARSKKLVIDQNLRESDLLEHLWKLISDQPDKECRQLIEEMRQFRLNLINEAEQDPTNLIIWLYENQGKRRFDSSNRLFLVLVNENNFFNSWQLKRNRTLLCEKAGNYLDNLAQNPGRNITFTWDGTAHNAISDAIIVRHAS